MIPTKVAIDRDGNVIRKGMSVVSGRDIWIVGSVTPRLIRLDRIYPTIKGQCRVIESRYLGHRRFYCLHIIGFIYPTIIK